MKIIHTSDWHLGARFHEEERIGEHRRILSWLLERIREEKPDALVVAGETAHGSDHWRQVAFNGLLLARTTGADPVVVRLFALFHDSRRFDEWADPEHGPRGAELAQAWRGVRYELDDARQELLVRACRVHTSAQASTGDVTVDTCLDADRLDLGRVGIRPHPARVLTDAARDIALRAQSEGLLLGTYRTHLQSLAQRDTSLAQEIEDLRRIFHSVVPESV